jgi:predicted Zn finger-like uncharacterized protein
VKFLCDQCKAKYQIADEKAAGKTVRMKCRKCGHLIEVRAALAAVAESTAPQGGAAAASGAAAPRAPQRAGTTGPRTAPLATSLAAAKPALREKSGALAGAFKTNVQRDDEGSAPIDMSDLSPSDEWYVAINGVPVGPIRNAEIRRKAALGGVTEDSLAWQEGLDEWRPVRFFPELAAIVREAIASGRASLTPAPPGRSSMPPPPRAASPARPNTIPPARAPAPRSQVASPPVAAAARSNVVPITSRLATAERLEEAPEDRAQPQGATPVSELHATPHASVVPSVVPDPFANAPAAPAALAKPAAPVATPIPLAADARARRQPPWVAIAMIAAAVAFGVTTGIVFFLRPAPQPQPVIVQVPAAPVAAAPSTAAAPAAPEVPEPAPTAAPVRRPSVSAPAAPKETAAAAPSSQAPARGPLDLHSLAQGTIAPTEDPGSEAPRAPGQCLSQGQVQQVIGLHQAALQRTCWERNPTNKAAVRVSVTLMIEPDGSAQGVSASAEELSVARCVENDIRSWHFPAAGCSQKVGFSFNFVRQ